MRGRKQGAKPISYDNYRFTIISKIAYFGGHICARETSLKCLGMLNSQMVYKVTASTHWIGSTPSEGKEVSCLKRGIVGTERNTGAKKVKTRTRLSGPPETLCTYWEVLADLKFGHSCKACYLYVCSQLVAIISTICVTLIYYNFLGSSVTRWSDFFQYLAI